MSSILQAAFGDIIPNKHMTLIFAILFGIAGFAVIIFYIVASILVNLYDVYFLFWIFTGLLYNDI